MKDTTPVLLFLEKEILKNNFSFLRASVLRQIQNEKYFLRKMKYMHIFLFPDQNGKHNR